MDGGFRLLLLLLGAGAGAVLLHSALKPGESPPSRGRGESSPPTPPRTQAPPAPAPPAPPQPSPGRGEPHAPPGRMPRPNMNDPQIAQWKPFVDIAAVTASINMKVNPVQLAAFAMAWLAIETGGNPCDVGESTATGPDGYPREVGLFQIFNPDDFRALGATAGELVTYCVRPERGAHEHPDTRNNDGGYLDGSQPNPKKLTGGPAVMATSLMNAAQISRHLELGLGLIKIKRAAADHYMSAVDLRWPTTGQDYWRLVKLYHALPSIVNTGLAQVAHKLGRAPLAWAEFRKTYEQLNPRARFDPTREPKDQDIYFKALENAEWTGGQIPDVGSVA